MKDDSSKKIRVDFRKNRNSRTRANDLTQRYRDGIPDEEDAQGPGSERISGKGELVRKRTVVGRQVELESAAGERGDFLIEPEIEESSCLSGRVLAVRGLYSQVEDEQGRVFTCLTRRVLKTLSTGQRQIVVTGDRVLFRDACTPGRLEGFIERVETRHGTLSRSSRERKHIIVTNVDQALIVTSVAEPVMKPNLIDRLLVTCQRADIRPIICINKIDLGDPVLLQPFIGVYAQMGYKVVCVSTKTGDGIERLRRILTGRESVVAGQSGVGKSSILNAVIPELDLRVRQVSDTNQKGRHTTTTAELLTLPFGGYVVDTPGIRQFTLWDFVPEEVPGYYRDLRPYESLCRYPDCTHTHEELCAVKDAVADGWLDLRRYESYLALRSGSMD